MMPRGECSFRCQRRKTCNILRFRQPSPHRSCSKCCSSRSVQSGIGRRYHTRLQRSSSLHTGNHSCRMNTLSNCHMSGRICPTRASSWPSDLSTRTQPGTVRSPLSVILSTRRSCRTSSSCPSPQPLGGLCSTHLPHTSGGSNSLARSSQSQKCTTRPRVGSPALAPRGARGTGRQKIGQVASR